MIWLALAAGLLGLFPATAWPWYGVRLAEDANGHVHLRLKSEGLHFRDPVLNPPETMIFKGFDGDGPFEVLEGPSGAVGYWRDGRDLEVFTNLGKDDWLDYLARGGKLSLSWAQGLAPGVTRREEDAGSFPSFGGLGQYGLENGLDAVTGRFVTTLGALPFALAFQERRDGDDLTVAVRFNRPMVGPEKVGQDCPREEWPLSMSPDLATSGRWTGRSEFEFGTLGQGEKEYEAKVVGQAFSLSVRPGLKAQTGEAMAAGDLPTWTPDPFRVLGFRQAGFDGLGRVSLELFFNKEVSRPDLEKALRFLSVSGDDGEIERPVEGMAIDGLGESGGADGQGGLEVRLSGPLENGTRLRLWIRNLKSADGKASIPGDDFDLMIKDDLSVASSRLVRETWAPFRAYFRVDFNSILASGDLGKYVALDPPIPFETSVEYSRLLVYAPFGREEVEVTLRAGLPGDGGILARDLSFKVGLDDDRRPMAAFSGEGRYLSPGLPMLVRIQGREADFLRLQAWRMCEDNLVAVLNLGQAGLYLTDRLRVAQSFSEGLFDREASLGDESQESFERLVDLGEILAGEGGDRTGRGHGIYILKATPLAAAEDGRRYAVDKWREVSDYKDPDHDAGDLYDWPERYLPLVVTDLGLSARSLPGSVQVWVVGLSAAKPVAGALVTFYDAANQVLAQGRSGPDGLFGADLDSDRVTVVTARLGDDLSYLVLGGRGLSHGQKPFQTRHSYRDDERSLDHGGGWRSLGGADIPLQDRYLGDGHEAFLILPRDLFRPGERIEAKALVRDRDMAPPREAFPLICRLIDPVGQVISQRRADLSTSGGLELAGEIPFSGRTGKWSLEVLVPGADRPLGAASFRVDDFVPPRLRLSLEPQGELVVGTRQSARLRGEARYLFGAKGDGLDWEMRAWASADGFSAEGFEGFLFGVDASLAEFARELGDQAGKLDQDGLLDYRLALAGDPLCLPPAIRLLFSWQVMEDGGRWDAQTASLVWYPREVILGLGPPSDLATGRSLDFELVAIKAEGGTAEVAGLAVEVSRVISGRYSMVRHGKIRSQRFSRLEPVLKTTLALAGGRGILSLPPLEPGTYEFLARGPDGETLRQRLGVGPVGPAEPPSPDGRDTRLGITLDKPFYGPGDTAMVRVEAPFDGLAWLTLETDEFLFSGIGEIGDGILELGLPVPGGIAQNAHLTVSAVRPLAPGRAGLVAADRVSLEMDRQYPHALEVGAEIGGRLAPSAKARLKISLKDPSGKPLAGEATVALVDWGLLLLSGWDVPDPLGYFGRSRYPGGRAYDLYDLLLPQEEVDLPFLVPGGGDSLAELLSPYRRDREMLSLFLASVEVGQDGEAEVELDIPEYSGRARLAVVAASGDRFGSHSETVEIGRDLTVEPTLPLALAPGDCLVSTARIFLDPKSEPEGATTLSVEAKGPLSIERIEDESGRPLPQPLKPRLSPGEGRTYRIFLRAVPGGPRGEPLVGPASLVFSASRGPESFALKAGTVVRPPYPWTSRSSGGQLLEAETVLDVDFSGFLPGTAKASFAMAAGPAVEAARAAAFLRDYPYGCLEQTVSRAWPHLAALDLGSLDGEASAGESRVSLEAAVRRLATMRSFRAGFSSWPGGSSPFPWGSAYAAHFLVEASRRVELPPGLLEDALAYLRRLLAMEGRGGTPKSELQSRAYALFVLALNGEAPHGHLNRLMDRRAGLSNSSLILLAAAEALMDGRPGALADLELRLPGLAAKPGASLPGSRASERALLLNAWALADPQNPRTAELAAEVAEQGRRRQWTNTQENGLAIMALGNFMRLSGGSEPYRASVSDARGRLLAGGGETDSLGLDSGILGTLPDGRLRISLAGAGRPWYSLTVSGVGTEPPEPVQDAISLRKTWRVGHESVPLGPEVPEAPLSVPKGQLVEVELSLASLGEATENVVVADLLPGGFEIAVGPSGGLMDWDGDGGKRARDDGSPHLELREDRVIAVLPVLRGRTTLRYSLRAVTAGEFLLPPATAEGMYLPERRAVLPASRVTVTDGAMAPPASY
ncbi:MAG: hypothetical protein LBL95_04150 [Deltaproteobacteria bacterium]|jgi:uncharacterized protein YfaS (alpha-2-macroglobulin family)|nr:hypothetical protein [Deltaproteobacteria bacterium]